MRSSSCRCLPITLILLLIAVGSEAFTTPTARSFVARPISTTARSFGVDPSHFTDTISSLQDAFASSSVMLSDAVDAATSAMDNVPAAAAVDAAKEVAESGGTDNGWFGFLTVPIMGLLQIIHSLVAALGTGNSWGVSIILLTLLIKVVTYPLTKTQLESTNKMQAMQPAIKELQAKYQSNPEVMNQKIAEFYQTNEINPLAGCLPSLVQIPVFIGLYRAVLELAKQNKLDEPFLFLPNLEGPTYGADPATASDWILKGWVDGTPPLGWDDTIAFLILPIFLIISQFVSMELMQPKTDDPAQQQSNIILKILPIMIGWFALNVPAALSVYWVTNNIVTTGMSLWIRNTMKVEAPKTAAGGAASATMEPPVQQTIFTPPREKPAGFGGATPPVRRDDGGVKPITAMDAEIVDDDDDDDVGEEATSDASSNTSKQKKRRKGGKKKKKD